MIYPEPSRGGRGRRNPLETEGFSAARLSQARAVLRHSRALAVEVVQGRKSLDKALEQVADENEESASAETQLTALRQFAPDLAELVNEERLALHEAHATMRRRIAEAEAAEANKRETMLRLGESAWQATTAWASEGFLADVNERLADDDFRRLWRERLRLDPARLVDIRRGAEAFAKTLRRILAEERTPSDV